VLVSTSFGEPFPPILVLRPECLGPSPNAKAKKAHGVHLKKTPPRQVKATRQEELFDRDMSGFSIDRDINVDGQQYRHLVSIIHSSAHFWSVVTYKNETWLGGTDLAKPAMVHHGSEPFVCPSMFQGGRAQPVIHVYAHKAKLEPEKATGHGEDGSLA
jgi:hypothetical protein